MSKVPSTPSCEVPCGSPEAPTCLCGVAAERGERIGAQHKIEGLRYGKVHGRYPSNPYHTSDPRCAEYDKAYEEACYG